MNMQEQKTEEMQMNDRPKETEPIHHWKIFLLRLFWITAIISLFYLIAYMMIVDLVVTEATDQIQLDLTQVLNGLADDIEKATYEGIDLDTLLALAETGEINALGFSDDPRYHTFLNFLDHAHHVEPEAWPYLYIPSEKERTITPVVDLLAKEAYWDVPDADPFGFLDDYTSNSGAILVGLEELTYRPVDAPEIQKMKAYAASVSGRVPWMADKIVGMANWLTASGICPQQEFGTYGDEFGQWASGYRPLKNAEGEIVAAIGVDFIADSVRTVQDAIQSKLTKLFGYTYIILFLTIAGIGSFFTNPVRQLVSRAQKIADGDFSVDLDMFTNRRGNNEVTELSRVLSLMVKKILAGNAQLQKVMNEQADYIIRWTPNLDISFVNAAYQLALGKPEEEILGSQLDFSLHPTVNDATRTQTMVEIQALTPENDEIEFPFHRQGFDGSSHWIQWRVTAFFANDGTATEYQAVGRDITELKVLQSTLEVSNKHLQDLSLKMIEVREEENAKFSRMLHDDVLQELSKVSLKDANRSDYVVAGIDGIINNIRILIAEMRSPMLEYGLRFAIQDYHVETLTVGLPEGLEVDFKIEPSWSRFDSNIEVQIFKIIVQACLNAVKHANAKNITIEGEITDTLIQLEVRDDGAGFVFDDENEEDWKELFKNNHFGMLGMRERAQFIDANLKISTALGTGTIVTVQWLKPGVRVEE